MKIGIANVGVNTSHRRLRSPIFEDGSFEFVPVPYCSPSDCPDELGNCSECIEEYTVFPRYCELPSSNGIEFSEFIPLDRLRTRAHNDPERAREEWSGMDSIFSPVFIDQIDCVPIDHYGSLNKLFFPPL